MWFSSGWTDSTTSDLIGPAECPAAVKVDEVGDHGHQRAWPGAFSNRLVADVVQQRMDRQHDVGVMDFQQVGHCIAYAGAEDCADRGERRPGVAGVVDGAPGGSRPPDHRRVERRQSPDDGWALSDERVGHGDDAGRVEQLERVREGAGCRAVTAARIAEENQDPWRTACRRRLEWRRLRMVGVRRAGAYFRRAAARRAIHRMLYWASRKLTNTMAMIPMLTHRMVRFASSPGGSGAAPAPSVFC